jgi:hypothetical protein
MARRWMTANTSSSLLQKSSTSILRQKEDDSTWTKLKELVANFPAAKKVILDTCNAGATGDAILVALQARCKSKNSAIKVLSRAADSILGILELNRDILI